MGKYRFLLVNGVVLLTLLGGYWGRKLEDATIQDPEFLKRLNLPFGDWKISDLALGAEETALLKPDAVLVRNYEAPISKELAQVVVIAGHRKQSIHTPAYCMAAGGWETLSKNKCSIHLDDRTIEATRLLMSNQGKRMLVTFFFTDGRHFTDNLVRFQGVQLLNRFHSTVPLGALVRVQVPVMRDLARAESLSDNLALATVPAVVSALRNVHLVGG